MPQSYIIITHVYAHTLYLGLGPGLFLAHMPFVSAFAERPATIGALDPTSVNVHSRVDVHVCLCMHVCINCVCVCICVCVCVCVCVCACLSCVYVFLCVHVHDIVIRVLCFMWHFNASKCSWTALDPTSVNATGVGMHHGLVSF